MLRGGGIDDVHATLIDGHLAPLVATAHESTKVGAALLWGNVAASCAAAFGAFAGAPGARSGGDRRSRRGVLRPRLARSFGQAAR